MGFLYFQWFCHRNGYRTHELFFGLVPENRPLSHWPGNLKLFKSVLRGRSNGS